MTTVGLAMFCGLYYWAAATKIGYTLSSTFRQPIVISFFMGLIFNDLSNALIIGASIEMIYLGMISPGNNMPADEALAGIIAIPIALKTGMTAQEAVVLAVPIGVIGALIEQVRRTGNAKFIHNADKIVETGDTKKLWLNATIYPLIFAFVLRFPPVFLATYLGPDAIQTFMNFLPEWILTGFNVAGGVLPALGFAIVVVTLGKPKLVSFFILGYFMVVFLNISTMAAAIFGTLLAIILVFVLDYLRDTEEDD